VNRKSVSGSILLAVLIAAPEGMGQITSFNANSNSYGVVQHLDAAHAQGSIKQNAPKMNWSEPKPVSATRFNRSQFVMLSIAVYGASFADMHQTIAVRKNFWWYETDPFAKPFVKLQAPAYYATGLAMATGVNWLSWKMGRSRRWHKLSAVPQILAIAGNLHGVKTNLY